MAGKSNVAKTTMIEATYSPVLEIARQLDESELRVGDRGKWRIAITSAEPVRPRAGWFHLIVALADANGTATQTPIMTGIVSGGGRGVKPWFECRFYPEVTMADGTTFDARECGLEAALIDRLGELVPDGGHLMVEYESPGQSMTHAELLLRVPPAATYLGALMFHAGFRGAFKDWYISEGGHEGPRKLQANKSPNAAAARVAMRTHVEELTVFIKQPLPKGRADGEIVARAQNRARAILKEISRKRS
ncbi:MAG: hypothetical protein QOG61_1622 [Candidatus Binataceae bacterium]|jgi:hypothetical protein|nr:hypothetical protein [Candidatus Binataceae bacterium]